MTSPDHDRLVTITDEAFGLQPVADSTDALLSMLERLLAERDAALREALAERDRLRDRRLAVFALLEANGCDCECAHYFEDHDDDCERCLACRVEAAMGRR